MQTLADEIALACLAMQYEHARKIAPKSVDKMRSYSIAWQWTCRQLAWLDREREEEFLIYLKEYYRNGKHKN